MLSLAERYPPARSLDVTGIERLSQYFLDPLVPDRAVGKVIRILRLSLQEALDL